LITSNKQIYSYFFARAVNVPVLLLESSLFLSLFAELLPNTLACLAAFYYFGGCFIEDLQGKHCAPG
jgi:hypothetical protein